MSIKRRQIGAATLYCGDALEILPTLGPVGSVLTDPPYCSGGGGGRNNANTPTNAKYVKARHMPEFQGDSLDQRAYLIRSIMWLQYARALAAPGALCAVFTDWRQLPVTSDALQLAGWVWRGVVPWDKTEAVRPQLGRYRNQAEFALWGTNGQRPLVGKVARGVVRAPVPRIKHHVTAKPVELMAELLAIMEGPVLDPFMGSGTVGVACIQAGLPYIGIEIDPTYFEVACSRLKEAVNAEAAA